MQLESIRGGKHEEEVRERNRTGLKDFKPWLEESIADVSSHTAEDSTGEGQKWGRGEGLDTIWLAAWPWLTLGIMGKMTNQTKQNQIKLLSLWVQHSWATNTHTHFSERWWADQRGLRVQASESTSLKELSKLQYKLSLKTFMVLCQWPQKNNSYILYMIILFIICIVIIYVFSFFFSIKKDSICSIMSITTTYILLYIINLYIVVIILYFQFAAYFF